MSNNSNTNKVSNTPLKQETQTTADQIEYESYNNFIKGILPACYF